MSISKSDLGRSISDLEGKNSKFRRIAFLRMATKNISVRFYRFPIKTVGGVRKSTKKCLKLTSLAPAPVEPKIGQPRNVCPEVTFSKIHLPYQFRDNRTSGKWSKSPDGQTDVRTDICVHTSASPSAADKNIYQMMKTWLKEKKYRRLGFIRNPIVLY